MKLVYFVGGLKQNTDPKFLLTKEDFLSNFSRSETEQVSVIVHLWFKSVFHPGDKGKQISWLMFFQSDE